MDYVKLRVMYFLHYFLHWCISKEYKFEDMLEEVQKIEQVEEGNNLYSIVNEYSYFFILFNIKYVNCFFSFGICRLTFEDWLEG